MNVRDLEPDLTKPFVILIAHAHNRALFCFSPELASYIASASHTLLSFHSNNASWLLGI